MRPLHPAHAQSIVRPIIDRAAAAVAVQCAGELAGRHDELQRLVDDVHVLGPPRRALGTARVRIRPGSWCALEARPGPVDAVVLHWARVEAGVPICARP